MHPKNSTTPLPAQARQRVAYQTELGNASASMREAGAFIWAMAALLRRIHEEDHEDKLLSSSIVNGLSCGMSIIGAKLMDEGDGCQQTLSKDWASARLADIERAPQKASQPNRGAKAEVSA